MFAFISLLFDLSHADVDLVIREFRVDARASIRPIGSILKGQSEVMTFR